VKDDPENKITTFLLNNDQEAELPQFGISA